MSEDGDYTSVMGQAYRGPPGVNVPHRVEAGWLTEGAGVTTISFSCSDPRTKRMTVSRIDINPSNNPHLRNVIRFPRYDNGGTDGSGPQDYYIGFKSSADADGIRAYSNNADLVHICTGLSLHLQDSARARSLSLSQCKWPPVPFAMATRFDRTVGNRPRR